MKKIFILLTLSWILAGCGKDSTEPTPVEDKIEISSPAVTFKTDGVVLDGENAITVTCNGPWRLTGKKTWCKPSVVAGKSGDQVTFTAEPNESTDIREITYTFMCGSKIQRFKVTQKSHNVLDFNSKEFTTEATGGEVIIKFTTNLSFTYQSVYDQPENAGWLNDLTEKDATRAPVVTNIIRYQVAANTSNEPRSATVTFLTSENDKGVITIKQKQNNVFVAKTPEIVAKYGGDKISVSFSTNVNYYVNLPSWIHKVETPAASIRGVQDFTLDFTVDAAEATRQGKISFRESGGSNEVGFITVKQIVPAKTYSFPDANFRKFCSDKGWIVIVEGDQCNVLPAAAKVTEMDCSNRKITSLVGLEHFPNLETLVCKKNAITKLDLSKNIKVRFAGAESDFGSNPITELNLGDMVIESFETASYAKVFNGVTSIKIISSKLQYFTLSYQTTMLKTLDVVGCPKLYYIYTEGNTGGLDYGETLDIRKKKGQSIRIVDDDNNHKVTEVE